MPDHVHGVLFLTDTIPAAVLSADFVRAGLKPALTDVTTSRAPLPEVIRALKTFSSRRINALRALLGTPVWQRSYYDRVIRGNNELYNVRQYIMMNPKNWETGKSDDEYK